MQDKRAQTLEALDAYVHTQRQLLRQMQSDVERLQTLRNEALAEPERFLLDLEHQLGSKSFRLSEHVDSVGAGLPEDIDWSLFSSHDPAPLRNLALDARVAYAQRNQPRMTQCSELSELQKFVKDARRDIVDPVLASLAQNNSIQASEEDEDEELDPEELKRERERAKIRELKKRRIRCGLTIPLRSQAAHGVFIRTDMEDESAEVDISLEEDPPPTPRFALVDDTASLEKHTRTRRPSSKLQDNLRSQDTFPRAKGARRKLHAKTVNEEEPPEVETDTKTKISVSKPSKESGKPKSETYKQAWSVSEQHLLERLLEEIPEGEKNRWQKISRAMQGRRTPRQVASRVQKYFEKLKRFGIGTGADGH